MIANVKNFLKKFDTRIKFYRSLKNPERILELGCGSCDNCMDFHRMYPSAQICGVDKDKATIPDYVEYMTVNIDKEALPYPDNHFDAILFSHVLEHVNDYDHIGREINRVLRSGGLLYVEVPNWTTILIPSFKTGDAVGGPFNFFDDPAHVRPFTQNSLRVFVSGRCSLKVIKLGAVRNIVRLLLLDWWLFPISLILQKRRAAINSFWNIYGWCIHSIGEKR